MRPVICGTLLLAACASGGANAAREPAPLMRAMTAGGAPFAFPEADSAHVLHFLNRLSFGPRPGDIARVQQAGFGRWLAEQLAPERIPDSIQDAVRARYALAFEPPAQLWRE